MFGEDEIDALILGLRLVASRGDPGLTRAADDALAKILAVLPEEMEAADLTSGLLVAPRAGGPSAQIDTIRQGLRCERKLLLSYTDQVGTATTRLVWPVALGFFSEAEVLAAWCELRGDFRHFRLDRIAGITLQDARLPRRRRLLLAEWRLEQGIDGPR